MDEKRLQTSESLFLAALLAIVGGFLDAYSYLLRGGVFANAQTGNIALLGVYIQRRNGSMIIHYLVPILAFAAGVVLVEIMKKTFKTKGKIHWRQRIVQTFRKVHGNAFASTMCTGNLRSGTESMFQYRQTKDRTFFEKGLKYYSVIAFFIIGAVIGGLMTGIAEEKSVFLCSIVLLLSGMIMVQEYRN